MNQQNDDTGLSFTKKGREGKNDFPGYPLYPDSEDIYNKFREEKDINPEEISGIKILNEATKSGTNNEKCFHDDVSGSDLDIPGSELDDDLENIGSEDEENNFYSLGGDGNN